MYKKFYHVTPTENVESIRSQGLIPQIGFRSKLVNEQYPLVYLFGSRIEMEEALMNWLGECFLEPLDESKTNWDIGDLSVIILALDPHKENIHKRHYAFEWICDHTIGPEHIVDIEHLEPDGADWAKHNKWSLMR